MTVHRYVVGRIGEHHLRLLAPQELFVALGLERVGAEQPVTAELPEIADRATGVTISSGSTGNSFSALASLWAAPAEG